MKKLNINFPLYEYEQLIIQFGWSSLDEWYLFWKEKEKYLRLGELWGDNVKEDWIWGLALPLLSKAYKLNKNYSERKIIGISALPGTGKTTLGKWLELASKKLQFKISVISIDDFYLPADEMLLAIKNNPWDVSRGFPGSHSTELMMEKLLEWKRTGQLNVPIFDKSLRDGLGDRSYWRKDKPDLLIIEGWFLGVSPLSNYLEYQETFSPPLKASEISYRLKIQNNLKYYQNVWNLIDDTWHLKPSKFEFMYSWKSNQEKEMLNKRGHALQDKRLSNFIRMLNVSIPHKCFDQIKSDVLLLINKDRKLIKVGLT